MVAILRALNARPILPILASLLLPYYPHTHTPLLPLPLFFLLLLLPA
jgi:hypothetical protein